MALDRRPRFSGGGRLVAGGHPGIRCRLFEPVSLRGGSHCHRPGPLGRISPRAVERPRDLSGSRALDRVTSKTQGVTRRSRGIAEVVVTALSLVDPWDPAVVT